MEILTMVLLALALNIDALGAGTAYGMRNIKLPLNSLLIISCMSAAAITLSMLAGHALSAYVSETFAHYLGGTLLVVIGAWVLYQSLRDHKSDFKEIEQEENSGPVVQIRIKSLGLVIQVLREPTRADLDRSGVISPTEAILLGLALAMDAFVAGFAVSMLGFSVLLTATIVGIGHLVLAYAGVLLGKGFATTAIGRQLSVIPGCILIVLGLFQFYG